ncbi:MAG: protein phosphatase 2C domain-containing protein [Thermodesulfobacteriota bacterium]
MTLLNRLLRRCLTLAAFGRTDTGLARGHNEDSFCVLPGQRLFVVADGMGGHNAGEVASRIAVETLVVAFPGETVKGLLGKPEAIRHALIRGVREANEAVMAAAVADDARAGMGCTLIAAFCDRAALHTCHLGDVRCYLASRGSFRQITTDHSQVAQQVAAGLLDPEEARVGFGRNIVTRAVGFPMAEDPECHQVELAEGDRALLCSDGLWSMVPDARLAEILAAGSSAEAICNQLVDAANEAGGRDNITAVVILFGKA